MKNKSYFKSEKKRRIFDSGMALGCMSGFLEALEFMEAVVPKVPTIVKVDFENDRATIMHFSDGTYTKAVCDKDDVFNKDAGFAICLAKKLVGNAAFAGARKAFTDENTEDTNTLDAMFEEPKPIKVTKVNGKYTDEVKAHVKASLKRGMSIKEVAKKYGISEKTIRRWK